MAKTEIQYFPTIAPVDREKVPPEIAEHLENQHTHFRLVFDRLQNHATAVANMQRQIDALQAQVNKK